MCKKSIVIGVVLTLLISMFSGICAYAYSTEETIYLGADCGISAAGGLYCNTIDTTEENCILSITASSIEEVDSIDICGTLAYKVTGPVKMKVCGGKTVEELNQIDWKALYALPIESRLDFGLVRYVGVYTMKEYELGWGTTKIAKTFLTVIAI